MLNAIFIHIGIFQKIYTARVRPNNVSVYKTT